MKTDKDGPRSNPYRPDPAKCCEACVFGGKLHALWCPRSLTAREWLTKFAAFRKQNSGSYES